MYFQEINYAELFHFTIARFFFFLFCDDDSDHRILYDIGWLDMKNVYAKKIKYLGKWYIKSFLNIK